jgi:hypothetical protein
VDVRVRACRRSAAGYRTLRKSARAVISCGGTILSYTMRVLDVIFKQLGLDDRMTREHVDFENANGTPSRAFHHFVADRPIEMDEMFQIVGPAGALAFRASEGVNLEGD